MNSKNSVLIVVFVLLLAGCTNSYHSADPRKKGSETSSTVDDQNGDSSILDAILGDILPAPGDDSSGVPIVDTILDAPDMPSNVPSESTSGDSGMGDTGGNTSGDSGMGDMVGGDADTETGNTAEGGTGGSSTGGGTGTNDNTIPIPPSDEPTNPPVVITPLPEPGPTERMASITASGEFLASLGSMLNVNPSSESFTDFHYKLRGSSKDWKSLLSEFGEYDSVNSAMWMTVVSMSGDLCRDLANKEKAQSSANRRFFANIDLGGGSASKAAIDSAIRKLARSLWSRNETSEELNLLYNEIQSNHKNSNFDAMVTTCSAMAATLHTQGRGI